MDIKTIMTKGDDYSTRANEGLARIKGLIAGLDRARKAIDSIKEADTKEALDDAYKKLETAFLTCIDCEQDRVWMEVRNDKEI